MRWAAIAGLVLLSTCTGAGQWSKAGTDAAATSQEYADCEAVAQAAVKPQIEVDQDIVATRGADWQRADVFHEQTGMMRSGIAERTRSIIDGCMRAKGFAQGS